MGKQGIRYAAKVELEKPAATLPYLHVCIACTIIYVWTI